MSHDQLSMLPEKQPEVPLNIDAVAQQINQVAMNRRVEYEERTSDAARDDQGHGPLPVPVETANSSGFDMVIVDENGTVDTELTQAWHDQIREAKALRGPSTSSKVSIREQNANERAAIKAHQERVTQRIRWPDKY